MTMPACSCGNLIIHSSATQECNASCSVHDTQDHLRIQTHGRPVVVLCTDVECHTGSNNYPL